MFNVSIAVRQRGTINLQSGVFDKHDAVDIITSMTDLSKVEASLIISEATKVGLHRWRGESFEILAKTQAGDNSLDKASQTSETNETFGSLS